MTNISNLPSVDLRYVDSRSDKTYQARIVESGDGYDVEFAYGKTGSSLRTGVKNPKTVSLDKALGIYQKLVDSKLNKGYESSELGEQPSHRERENTGYLPQLLNAIDEKECVRLIDDDSYVLQEKHDGERTLLIKEAGQVIFANRQGMTKAATPSILAEAAVIPDGTVLDGESIGETFHVFDIIKLEGANLGAWSYGIRLDKLEYLFEYVFGDLNRISLVDSFRIHTKKVEAFNLFRSQEREGVVLKSLLAPYEPGRPSSGGSQLKFKFVESATCRVQSINDKRSVAIEMLKEDSWVGVGNVSIPANKEIPNPGVLVEVRYLYAYEGGSLYQPFYLGRRSDLLETDCAIEQLKFKKPAYRLC